MAVSANRPPFRRTGARTLIRRQAAGVPPDSRAYIHPPSGDSLRRRRSSRMVGRHLMQARVRPSRDRETWNFIHPPRGLCHAFGMDYNRLTIEETLSASRCKYRIILHPSEQRNVPQGLFSDNADHERADAKPHVKEPALICSTNRCQCLRVLFDDRAADTIKSLLIRLQETESQYLTQLCEDVGPLYRAVTIDHMHPARRATQCRETLAIAPIAPGNPRCDHQSQILRQRGSQLDDHRPQKGAVRGDFSTTCFSLDQLPVIRSPAQRAR